MSGMSRIQRGWAKLGLQFGSGIRWIPLLTRSGWHSGDFLAVARGTLPIVVNCQIDVRDTGRGETSEDRQKPTREVFPEKSRKLKIGKLRPSSK